MYSKHCALEIKLRYRLRAEGNRPEPGLIKPLFWNYKYKYLTLVDVQVRISV
jgi:hypothetical protein